MKLEKEVDVWTAVQNYLDQDAAGTLTPETEMNKPEFKVYIGFKKDEVSSNANLGTEYNSHHLGWQSIRKLCSQTQIQGR